ncbi:MAG: class I SAM-dependent methyltransferase, partial [Proteobacteria bacterium]|nr:class I SAM-dependent methyltransferase [Pseudomonadota bacterium]
WKAGPAAGRTLDFAGTELLIMPGVFPPRSDTRLLVELLALDAGCHLLDLGTGTGALAVWAAHNGAARVVATDIAGAAAYNARENVARLGLQDRVEVRNGHMFSCISRSETFDLILANLPGRNKVAADEMAAAQWDTEFKAHRALFEGSASHLRAGGAVYMVKANYPDLPATVDLAAQHGFDTRVIGQADAEADDPRIYYALEFSPRSSR